MQDFGLYIILTKPYLGHERVAEICVRLGVKMLQLREKHMTDRSLLSLARRLRSITRGSETNFVINDRPDIAVLSDADFLHLGQDDLPINEARKLVGDMKIGLSTHSIEQAKEALNQKPDYIGFGPIYPTPTKEKPDPAVGTENLKKVLGFSTVPVVAIGGLFPENISEVITAGARNIAMVRYFMQAQTVEELERRITNIQSLLTKPNH